MYIVVIFVEKQRILCYYIYIIASEDYSMNKKLQVFVSSTYTDLIEERQAAVQAILDAGHIPAGMELFKAGNESQLKTIYKWIDESDVYMLILGGRYGSIEEKSGRSYTQLEYEYALSKNTPVFAVVLSDSFITQKISLLNLKNVMEQDYPEKYKSFKEFVMSKIIREVDDCKDIKIQVHATLNEFIHSYDLIGWVRNENDFSQLIKENNDLLKENYSLNQQILTLQEQLALKSKEQFGNYSFDELVNIFKNKSFVLPIDSALNSESRTIDALSFFYYSFNLLTIGIEDSQNSPKESIYIFNNIAPYYIGFNLLEITKLPNSITQRIQTTKFGYSFYAILESKNMFK